MTPKQARLIRETWNVIVPNADAVARQFYKNLFEIDPTAASLFSGTDMDRQHTLLIRALCQVIENVDKPDLLVPVLKELGRRHVDYGVEAHHYASVGSALIATLEQGLGCAFTEPIRSAWTAAYSFISGTMQCGENDDAALTE